MIEIYKGGETAKELADRQYGAAMKMINGELN
jgi:hypothetical protein